MEDSLYDEFGNYIGPELSGSEEVRVHRLCWRVVLSLCHLCYIMR